mgnify:CR=1 FL=1
MIEIDTSELEAFAKNIDRYKRKLKQGWLQYLNYLMTNANVQHKLEKKIKETVYDRPDPEMYKRTGNLLKSVRCEIHGDELYLYMDDEWLAQTKNANSISTSRGSAPNSNEGYAKNVEYDHSYNNVIGHPYTRSGSHYMEKTFADIRQGIQSGKYEPEKILEPLFEAWKR